MPSAHDLLRSLRPLPLFLVAVVLLPPTVASAARDPSPGFVDHSLDLPGLPAAVIPADMDRDGHRDLVVLVAFTAWGQTAETEQVTFDDIEGLVEVMSVVNALLDRRELRVYRGLEDGGFAAEPTILELDTSLHALQAGSRREPLLALTDEGVSAVRWSWRNGAGALDMVPLAEVETAFSGGGTFFSEFEFVHDLDGDGAPDLLLPTADGWSVLRGGADGFETPPAALVARYVPPPPDPEDAEAGVGPGSEDGESEDGVSDAGVSDEEADDAGDVENEEPGEDEEDHRARRPRQPAVTDLNGDGRPDLLVFGGRHAPVAYLNPGDLAFAKAVELEPAGAAGRDEEVVHVGTIRDGGPVWLVTQTELEPGDDAGMREEIDHAKRPLFAYRSYPLGPDLSVGPEDEARAFRAIGYTFQGSDGDDDDVDVKLPGGFQDLDGDGHLDLVAITLDFSLVPMIFRALVMGRISLRMDFHPWCQEEDGSFREVREVDLSGKFKLNLRNLQLKHLSQFAGDFDGDRRADFVQLGRGRKVTIHQGEAGCSYPERPSRKIKLAQEPKHLGLVRILDLNGDDRSDLYVVHPLRDRGSGGSIPVRVDLYVSE